MSESDPMTSPSYFRLGLFTLVGATLIVGGLLVLGAKSVFERGIKAQTILTESVNGLDVGSAVKYRGVTIGKVSQIEIAGRKYGLSPASNDAGDIVVEMSLEPHAFPHMNPDQVDKLVRRLDDQGLRARMATTGISGQAYVELDMLDPKEYPPPQLGFIPPGVYIPSAPSTMGEVVDAIERIANDMRNTNLAQVLGHYDQLVTRATVAIDGVNDVLQSNRPAVNAAVADLPEITRRLRNVSGRADQVLNDPRLDKVLASLPAAGDNASAAAAEFGRLVEEARSTLADDRDDLHSIMEDLRRAADDAAILTDDARQNPARVLFGKPPPPPKAGK
jgi:ABC-type transporter Mla subunit MlaD